MSEWIDWNGGERPVDRNVEVEIMSRSGVKNQRRAEVFLWNHAGKPSRGDILKYRVIEQNPTPAYYNNTFKGVKIDPYRICQLYTVGGGPREHALKKLLRGCEKEGQTELELAEEVRGIVTRWIELLEEEGN